jgi:hypothetical protein
MNNLSKQVFCATFLVLLVFCIFDVAALAQTCVQPPSGATAWWPLDETSGTIAIDVVGNKPGAHFGGPAHVAGKVRGALQFDGVDDFVGVGDSDLWAFGNRDFTIELWAYFNSPGGGTISHPSHIFIGNDEGPFTVNKWFFALGGGVLEFVFSSPTIGDQFLTFGPFAPNLNQWYHLAVRRQGNTFTVFVNGLPSGSVINTAAIPNPNAPLTIGQAESLGFMNGRLDEVTIYDRALTQVELQSIVDASTAGKCKPLPAVTEFVSPSRGGDTGSVTVRITGNGFMEGASAKLRRAGNPDIVANPAVLSEDGVTLIVSFNLTGKARGLWDVVVTNSDGTAAVLSQVFTIEAGRAAQVWVDIVGRGAIRVGRSQQFNILYGNRGNVDAVEGVLVISWPREDDLSIEGTVSAYGEPPPLPILEGSKHAQGIFIPQIEAGVANSIPINFVTQGSASQVAIGVSFLQASQVNTSAALSSVTFTPISRGLVTSPSDNPPVGSTAFMSPHFGNPFGHEGIVGLRSDGTLGVWDLWLTEELNKTPEGRQFIAEVGQPIPLSRSGLGNDWIDLVGGTYLGWGVPSGWTDEIGVRAATEYERLVTEGEAHWMRTWGKDPQNMRFNCSSADEYSYELAGLDPIPSNVQDVPEEALLTPAFHYRLYTGRQDFFKYLNLLQRILFGLEILHEIENAHLVDHLRERGLTKEVKADVVTSFDPNDKTGSKGEGEPKFLSGEEPLRYAIFFENVETATAPAQEVVITDQLDTSKIDLNSFSLGPISFGNKQIVPPPGLTEYTTTVDLRPAKQLLVKVEGHLNKTTGLLTWRFRSIDPVTGELPDDPFAGFLPPNRVPPEGDGSVLFTVMPKMGLSTGTEIRNQARIIFDTNAPIDTPQWFNTLDNTKPASRVLSQPAPVCAGLDLEWSGSDADSGIRNYDIFVSEAGSPFLLWLSNAIQTQATFQGVAGHTYAFYSIARDNAGNVEVAPATPDLVVTLPNSTFLSASIQFFPHNGGAGGVDLTVPAGCSWTAISNTAWIIIISDSSGTGSSTVSFEVRENFTGSARQGTLTIAGLTYTIIQDGGLGEDCQYSISPLSEIFGANGGAGTVTVFAEIRCAWQAVSSANWITITSPLAGIGNGAVSYTVAPNTSGSGRKGTITIAGNTFSIKQK